MTHEEHVRDCPDCWLLVHSSIVVRDQIQRIVSGEVKSGCRRKGEREPGMRKIKPSEIKDIADRCVNQINEAVNSFDMRGQQSSLDAEQRNTRACFAFIRTEAKLMEIPEPTDDEIRSMPIGKLYDAAHDILEQLEAQRNQTT